MLSNIGNSLIIINIIICCLIFYYSFFDLKEKNSFIKTKIIYLSLYQTTLSLVCFITLIAGFIVSDFSLITVFQNSHTSKPIFYKIWS